MDISGEDHVADAGERGESKVQNRQGGQGRPGESGEQDGGGARSFGEQHALRPHPVVTSLYM